MGEERTPLRERTGLHVCPVCDRPFVTPCAVLDSHHDGACLLDLECANCGCHRLDWLTEGEMELLDRELDRQSASMTTALEICELSRFMDEIDAFVEALETDLLLPEDF